MFFFGIVVVMIDGALRSKERIMTRSCVQELEQYSNTILASMNNDIFMRKEGCSCLFSIILFSSSPKSSSSLQEKQWIKGHLGTKTKDKRVLIIVSSSCRAQQPVIGLSNGLYPGLE